MDGWLMGGWVAIEWVGGLVDGWVAYEWVGGLVNGWVAASCRDSPTFRPPSIFPPLAWFITLSALQSRFDNKLTVRF